MSSVIETAEKDSFQSDAAVEADVRRRLLSGVSLLGLRQVVVQGLGAVTGIVLARILEPAEFGLYAVSTFFFYLFLAAGDLGLGASLIRDPEEPGPESYRLAFTVRQILDAVILTGIFVFARPLAALYGPSAGDGSLFRALAASAFLTSFQLIPMVSLERSLRFGRLAAVEIMQAVVYSATVLALVSNGFGVMSFGYAWMAFALAGAAAATALSPWSFGWRIEGRELRSRLRFALPYQGVGLLHLLRDGVNPILIGLLLGAGAAGYVNWALMLATFSVLAVLVLQRIYLPVFARLQRDRAELGRLFERVLAAVSAFNIAFAIPVLALVEPITVLVFGEKWLPALNLFYCFWVANLAGPALSASMSLFNALGQSGKCLRLTAALAVGTWAVAFPLIRLAGTTGFGAAFVIAQVASLAIVYSAKSEVKFSFSAIAWPAWIAGGIAWAFSRAAQTILPAADLITLGAHGGFVLTVYAASYYALARGRRNSISLQY